MSKGETWAPIGMETRTFRAMRQHRTACGPACTQTAVLRACTLKILAVVFGAFVCHNVLVDNYISKTQRQKGHIASLGTNTYPSRETGRYRSLRPETQSRVGWQGHESRGPRGQATRIANQKSLECLRTRIQFVETCQRYSSTGPTSADGTVWKSNLELHPALKHNEFSWAHHHPLVFPVNPVRTSTEQSVAKNHSSPAILGLNVQPALLR
jgi:hypothetical protein